MNQKLKKYIESKDFSQQRRWEFPEFPLFICTNKEYYSSWYLNDEPTAFFIHFDENVSTVIASNHEFLKGGYVYINDLLDGKLEYLDLLQKEYPKLKLKVDEYLKEREKNSEDITYQICKRFSEEHSYFLKIFYNFDFAMSDFIEQLEKKDPKLVEKFNQSVHPIEISYLEMEMKELRRIFNENHQKEGGLDENIKKLLENHIKDWGYIHNNYAGTHKETVEEIYKRGLEAVESKEVHLTSEEEREKSLHELPENYRFLSKAVSLVFNYRDQRKRLMQIGVDLFDNYLQKVSKQKNIPPEELQWLLLDEIYEVEEDKKYENPYLKNKERYVACFEKEIIDITEEDFEDIKNREKIDLDIKEFKGIVGNKGKTTGRVVICLTRADFGKVKEGDVLVASMTRPEFMPVMMKASAFVTNEGGMTCHAAIIAREMNKPCIIGTKIATQVLKDGMEVEVDADSGIVKIIK